MGRRRERGSGGRCHKRLARSREQCPSSHRQGGDHKRRQRHPEPAAWPIRHRDRQRRRRHAGTGRQPPIAHDTEQRHVMRHGKVCEALRREHDDPIRRRGELRETSRWEQGEQQRTLGAKAGLQLRPAGVGVDLGGLCRVRARRNDEYARDFVRRLVQRNAILESIHDPFGDVQPHDFMERRMLETEIHEGDAAPVARGDAGNVPRGLRRPRQIIRERHEPDQRRVVHEGRDQVAEPRERQLAGCAHCPGW
ncbi:MAG: hypothetical protein AUH68_00610 [Gemmatimonadetes bacterium 13_1_40CM_4_69_5]|nr:MAG: hypothetical protein AUH68_00610 [Gemmatimonadetes bacterium 13_1_40CM_4_69_5]